MPKLRGGGKGDMNVLVRVNVSKKPSSKERALLLELADEMKVQVKNK
jgi:DnaJ-class molecular chaperone